MATAPQVQNLTIQPGGPAVNVPVGASGGTIVNDGLTPIALAPTDPIQGTPTIVLAGGATPWPANMACFASIAPAAQSAGILTFIPGITVYSTGDASAGGSGLAGSKSGATNVVVGLASGQIGFFNGIPEEFTILSWGFVVAPFQAPMTAIGQASLQVSTVGGGSVLDTVATTSPTSDKLSGISFNLGAGGNTPIVPSVVSSLGFNATFFINYYNSGGPPVTSF